MTEGLNDLRELIRARFDALDCRMDEHRALADDRHKEVAGRLGIIEGDLRTGGRLIASHDTQIKALMKKERGEIGRLKLYVGLFVAGGLGVLWLLKLTHVL
jgi:hypothetical protein